MKLFFSSWQNCLVCMAVLLVLLSCTRNAPAALRPADNLPAQGGPTPGQAANAQAPSGTLTPRPNILATLLPPTRQPGAPLLTPTPDAQRVLPKMRSRAEAYTIQAGDTLGNLARRYGLGMDTLAQANQITDPDLLSVGQKITIPAPTPVMSSGPTFKIIPDSELVFGPASATLDLPAYIAQQNGFLSRYSEKLGEEDWSGAQIVALVSQQFSVNPRLLLALLQRQGGWLTGPDPQPIQKEYPLSYQDPARKGLYRQLSWAANNLNRGYYLWKVNGISHFVLADNSLVPVAPTLNAGTSGVQYLMSLLYGLNDWQTAVGPQGVAATYQQLFGYPFDQAVEPLVPFNLQQPDLQLPFENNTIWSFTGGPHGGWGDGSAWAGLDFAPPGDAAGCVQSDEWVTAVADGLITRSGDGMVVLDLDGDGYEQTGWIMFYLHIETRDRVAAGSVVRAGDRIGHPSCEGGLSNGTHVHLARRYNGEWIAADGTLPFILDGWVSQGLNSEYNGILKRNDQVVEAWDSRKPENQIGR